MDLESIESVNDTFEHLAVEHTNRPRFKRPIPLRDEGGLVFEIDEDFVELSDEEEEVFDLDIHADLEEASTSGLVQERAPNDKAKRIDDRLRLFSTSEFASRSLADFEEEMTSLIEDGSVKKLILREGNGIQVKDRSKIYYHYTTMCEGGKEAYDTSFLRKYPHVTDLRKDELLPGVSLAVRSMKVGEVSRFHVHPSLAYGEQGCPPRIPGNTKLLYIVEMIHCIVEACLNTFKYMTTDERATLPFSQILEEGHKLRGEGNRWYTDGNYKIAVRMYRKAINVLEEYPVIGDEDSGLRDELLWTLYSNLAQSYIKSGKPAQACNACKNGLKSAAESKTSAKLLYRFAQAKLMLNDAENALRIANQALNHDPDFPEMIEFKKKCRKEIKKQNKVHKEMCKKMFGNTGTGSSAATSVTAVTNEVLVDRNIQHGEGSGEGMEKDLSTLTTEPLPGTSASVRSKGEAPKTEEDHEIDWDEELVGPFEYCTEEVRAKLLQREGTRNNS